MSGCRPAIRASGAKPIVFGIHTHKRLRFNTDVSPGDDVDPALRRLAGRRASRRQLDPSMISETVRAGQTRATTLRQS